MGTRSEVKTLVLTGASRGIGAARGRGRWNDARAELDLRAAQYYVKFLDETTPEAVEVRATMGEGTGARGRRGRPRGRRAFADSTRAGC